MNNAILTIIKKRKQNKMNGYVGNVNTCFGYAAAGCVIGYKALNRTSGGFKRIKGNKLLLLTKQRGIKK